MKETPLLFTGAMVRAILEDRKTQTRRIVKPQSGIEMVTFVKGEEPVPAFNQKLCIPGFQAVGLRAYNKPGNSGMVRCPYGKEGDRVWVKETFSTDFKDHYPHDRIWYRADDDRRADIIIRTEAGKSFPAIYSPESKVWVPFKWRPSIFMPRWASRITLEIVSVKVERVQDISYKDCEAEGLWHGARGIWTVPGCTAHPDYAARVAAPCIFDEGYKGYKWLWDSINAKKPGCSWDENPWVFAIEFKRVKL